MSPEAERNFEAEWALLSRRLRVLLCRKRVPASQHDDLVQETALRLLSMWDSVDRNRALWPLTVTIALNLLRDRGRTFTKDDLVAELPDLDSGTDVETVGIARLELDRVRRALAELSPAYRSALMREIGSPSLDTVPDAAADKMTRMRARRKLRRALENVSGLVALRVRKGAEFLEGLFALREGGVTAASCMICLVLGVSSAVIAPAALTPKASARPADSLTQERTIAGIDASGATGATIEPSATATALKERAFARELDARIDAVRRKPAKRKNASGDPKSAAQTVPLPSSEDVPAVPPAPSVPVPGGDDAPTLPSTPEGDDQPSVPLPQPPSVPTPPLPPAPDLGEVGDLL
ncbi:MAG TPA: hypothetical protein VJ927_12815 [Actinomycetota bacterium]|nr:hypothetical protein [Actinomycetota bacterium]